MLFVTFLLIAAWAGEGSLPTWWINLLQQQTLLGLKVLLWPFLIISEGSSLVTKHCTCVLLRLILHVTTNKQQVHLFAFALRKPGVHSHFLDLLSSSHLHTANWLIKTFPGVMVLLLRSVFLICTAYEQESPISCLQGPARCHAKALWSLWLPCQPCLALLCPHLHLLTPRGDIWSWKPHRSGIPLAPNNRKDNGCGFSCEIPPDISDLYQAAAKSSPLLWFCIPACTTS